MIRAGNEIRAALIRADNRVMLHDMAGRTRTARQLLENVDRVAGALIARGAYGGKIGLWYRNSLRAVEAFLAVEWIGGTRVPVDPHAPPAEAKEVFAAAGVDLVVADRAHAMVLETPSLIHDDDTPLSGSPTWPAAKVSPDKTLLLYPRAVNLGQLYAIPVSYANWRATMRTNIDLYESGHFGRWLGGDECFLAAQQIMHGTGFVGTFPFLEMGLPQVLAETFDAAAILEAIDRHRVTTTVLVPPMMSRLVDAAIQRPGAGASLGHLIYGGAPVPPDVIRRTMRCFGCVLTQGYGRIEGGWPISTLGIEEHRAILAGDDELAASCGRPIDGVRTKLRQGDSVASDYGELCVASEMTVKDYADPDGWCSLGDLMRVNDAGYLFHQGRLDRMINTGYHIYPSEVEEAIAQVPGVAAVSVVGEPSKEWGMTVVADLVPEAGVPVDDLVDHINQALAAKLARYKHPRRFRIVDQLPHSASSAIVSQS
ncbi:MAG TPA: class I adenylate-forming enzyme family protein [Bradyrhizobium sp.]|jgi:acyl-CoA synthetase (AMP-forming)/AMP-acid ligase II|uniref:class I adenylate-forming enzyme family protein n=1 Tax=Bradyrhizobium sp. TaxID=376 RepID=UPI002D11A6BA|nr:class I adenylate-forming enzyme family protein [Bradyrhizobium sp.]HXB79650.1 class I adenylate-forming enzyme family protein [Bradyrhizobium sp.]